MHVASIEHLEQAYTFWDVFTGVVISCRLHLCKPEPAIYACLLETYGLDGANTVFIDDTEGESDCRCPVWDTHNQIRKPSTMRTPVTSAGLHLTNKD